MKWGSGTDWSGCAFLELIRARYNGNWDIRFNLLSEEERELQEKSQVAPVIDVMNWFSGSWLTDTSIRQGAVNLQNLGVFARTIHG